MKLRISATLILVISLLIASCTSKEDEVKEIKDCFENYKTAILNDRGEEASRYVDSRTMKYYSDVLVKVRTADSSGVDSLSLLDKLMVFLIRQRVSKDEIKSFDGKALLIYAIKNGMVGKENVGRQSLGEISVEEDMAIGQLLQDGENTSVAYHFYKEESDWKIDLTSLFDKANAAFSQMAVQSGMSENEFIFTILGNLTGKMPGNDIWQPVVR